MHPLAVMAAVISAAVARDGRFQEKVAELEHDAKQRQLEREHKERLARIAAGESDR